MREKEFLFFSFFFCPSFVVTKVLWFFHQFFLNFKKPFFCDIYSVRKEIFQLFLGPIAKNLPKKTKATDSAIFLMKFCHFATKIKEPTTFAKGFSKK